MALIEPVRSIEIVIKFRSTAIATPRVQNVLGRGWDDSRPVSTLADFYTPLRVNLLC
jgi:hypothetical protein